MDSDVPDCDKLVKMIQDKEIKISQLDTVIGESRYIGTYAIMLNNPNLEYLKIMNYLRNQDVAATTILGLLLNMEKARANAKEMERKKKEKTKKNKKKETENINDNGKASGDDNYNDSRKNWNNWKSTLGLSSLKKIEIVDHDKDTSIYTIRVPANAGF